MRRVVSLSIYLFFFVLFVVCVEEMDENGRGEDRSVAAAEVPLDKLMHSPDIAENNENAAAEQTPTTKAGSERTTVAPLPSAGETHTPCDFCAMKCCTCGCRKFFSAILNRLFACKSIVKRVGDLSPNLTGYQSFKYCSKAVSYRA